MANLKGLKESVITRSPGCAHSAVTSYYEWSQVYCPHLSPFSLLAGKNLNTTAVIPLSYSTFRLDQVFPAGPIFRVGLSFLGTKFSWYQVFPGPSFIGWTKFSWWDQVRDGTVPVFRTG